MKGAIAFNPPKCACCGGPTIYGRKPVCMGNGPGRVTRQSWCVSERPLQRIEDPQPERPILYRGP